MADAGFIINDISEQNIYELLNYDKNGNTVNPDVKFVCSDIQ